MDECVHQFAKQQQDVWDLYKILLAVENDEIYDSDYVRGVEYLNEIAVDKSLVLYLRARFHYTAKDYQEAYKCMNKALFYRKIDFDYWKLMLRICSELGDKIHQYYFSTLLIVNGQDGGSLPVPWEEDNLLRVIGQARLNPSSAPFLLKLFYKEGKIVCDADNLAGSYIGVNKKGEYNLFCGVYNSRGMLNMRAYLAALLGDMHELPYVYCEFPFDVMKCREEKLVHFECPVGKKCILPIAASEASQRIKFLSEGTEREVQAGKWEFSFYRFTEEKVEISSSKKIHVGEPIILEHSPKRRKLVLNILADALCWQVIKKQEYKAVPNIRRFFSHGIIYNNNFSVSEYTYPSIATIETGCYPYHTQIFNDKVPVCLDNDFKTISEKMKEKGYYCVNLMCDSAGMYNGVLRGFDRNLVNQITTHCYEAVHRCIEHLDAFSETDNYVYLHVSDAHPFNSNVQLAAHTQITLPWQDRILIENDTSVFKKKNAMNMTDNQYNIRQLDRYLGMLFDYVEEHYSEDEYVVNLFSDHGVSVYDDEGYLLSENQVGAALMMRGAGVPHLGMVEELTSVMDIYPIMGKVLDFDVSPAIDGRLPKAMGGAGRQYAISMSIYPGQTFKMCLRDMVYECRLETAAFTEISGRVKMDQYDVHIYRRTDRQEIMDNAVRERFMEEALKHIQSFVYF